MSMDAWQERQIGNLRKRQEQQVREDAERIREHVGYVIARLDQGRPDAVSQYALDIAAAAERMGRNAVALEVLDEARGILATTDAAEARR